MLKEMNATQNCTNLRHGRVGWHTLLVPIVVGYPHMITTNINVNESQVNDPIGILQHIVCSQSIDQSCLNKQGEQHKIENDIWNIADRNWDHAINGPSCAPVFANSSVETSEMQAHKCIHIDNSSLVWDPTWVCQYTCKNNVAFICSASWTNSHWHGSYPSSVYSTFCSPKAIKCKHKLFPMVPACTITIHKPQDGTFNKIIYKYLTQQLQQLIYVALSSVTSLTIYL